MTLAQTALAVLGSVLVVAAAVGALIAGVRTGILRSTVSDQQNAISGLRERVQVAEDAENSCVARMDVLEATLSSQKQANQQMAASITGATELSKIVDAQVEAGRQSTERHAEIILLLGGLVQSS